MTDDLEVAPFNARQTRYRLDAPIGRGGMSTVYRGRDLALDRPVAIKLFATSAADNEQLRSQQQEARLLASFAHHSLVRLYDVGVDFLPDGSPRMFLVMELVDGTDLRHRVRRSALPLLHVAHIGYDLAEGIAYLHAQGVTHRDVKPANVLLVDRSEGRRPRVKLADLGIAQIESQRETVIEDATVGTAAYLSPEQAAGEETGPAGDVYGLGLVLLEAITRRTEFPGAVVESAFARLDRDPVIPDDLPPEWRSVLRAMTRRRPQDRPGAEAVAEAFRRILVEEVRSDDGDESVGGVDRAAVVRRYNVLAPADDPELARLALLTVRLLRVDGAVLAIADDDRALVRAREGAVPDAARRLYVDGELERDAVHLEDLRSVAARPPLLGGTEAFRSYASAPIRTHDGVSIGVAAAFGREPRSFSDQERTTLQDIADMAMHEIELRRAVRRHLLPRDGRGGGDRVSPDPPPLDDGATVMTDATRPELLNDRYRLDEVLRRGDRTETHRGRDVLLGREVVVRIRSYAPGEDEERRRHHAIARLIAPLSHHNLIPLLDFDSVMHEDGSSRLVLIVEAARGRSLRNRLGTGAPLTTRQAAAVAFDLAEALEHLHEHGIVHLGLTPGVVLLAEQDEGWIRAQISDLATASRAGAPTPDRLTLPEAVPYVAPEQLRGEAAGPAADVYALSLVVLESLTGRRAFPDPMLRASDPDLRPDIPSGTPADLAELLRRGTSPAPEDRPGTTELARGFRRILAGELGRNRRLAPAIRSEDDEEARLAALHRYDLLDTPPEGAFDRITTLAARAFDMPVSTVSIVDRDRIWFKSHFGLDGGEIARDPGLCATVVSTGRAVYIPDAQADERASANPLIAGDLGLRSYAGIPLTSVDGYTLGALSVADYRPRTLTAEQLDTLEQLASMITHELEMRLATRRAVLSHD